jgi:hypothetical protein
MTLVYRALNGSAPSYLNVFQRVSDVAGRRRLRSAATHQLIVPTVKLSTVGSRAFPVVGAVGWNRLPADVATAPSVYVFRHRLKTHLFHLSFPGLVT